LRKGQAAKAAEKSIALEFVGLEGAGQTVLRADSSITRKYGGAGLGLAITRRLVDMYAGQIHVRKRAGEGKRIHVTLLRVRLRSISEESPCRRAKWPLRSSSRPAPPRLGGSSAAQLLLVEDNPVNQKAVVAILGKKGYRIDIANHGREAIEQLEGAEAPYDVVLMDVQMPVLDGLETTRLLRRNPKWEEAPIIAMTAHAMSGDRERCLEAGMSAYISKPVQPANLVSTVERYLEATASPAQVN